MTRAFRGVVRTSCKRVFVPRGIAWPQQTIDEALGLWATGWSARQVGRRLGIPRSTVTNWCRGRIPEEQSARCGDCDGCLHDRPRTAAYAFLLGLYLGDGFLTTAGAAVYLNVAMDTAYPGLVTECRHAISTVLPERRSHVRRHRDKNCVVVRSYGREWRCLFPQHGPGRKHRREIALEGWQRAAVDEHTGPFLRGLIHSDGWRGLNRVRVGGRAYAYPRYQFSNRSDDIRRLFTDGCDRLGIEWRPWGRWNISVARRDAVAKLDAFVGPKY